MANFYHRFLESVRRWPDVTAVEMQRHAGGIERYSYAELRRMSDSIGRWLIDIGIPRGARCAILAGNGPRWVAAYLGTIAAGATAVPFDIAFNADQVSTLLGTCGASLLFVDSKHLPLADSATAGLAIQLVLLEPAECQPPLPDLDTVFAAGADGPTPVEVDSQDTAAILFTSGTTTDPRGVMLTHANIEAESEAVFNFMDLGPSDAILGVLPLFHALAQMANLLLPLAAGARVVFLESLNTTELLRALRERDITVFCCVPQFFYLIHERIQKEVRARGRLAENAFRWTLAVCGFARRFGLNLGKLLFRQVHQMLGRRMRYLVTGGSRLDPDIGRDFQALGFELLQAYGLTETSGGALVTPPRDNVIGSVGKPLQGVEVKIVDLKPSEEGHPVGEIAIRGPIVMKGYYGRPDADAYALRDGWLYTGDLGYRDSHGNLFITGRRKEVIVLSSGKNVYPEEIEAHYLKSPWIREICVMGLESRPGEPRAERLHAVVVPNFELLRERRIVNTREVLRYDIEGLSTRLPSTKRILSYEIWQEELPRTTTRKLKRFAIEKRVHERQAAETVSADDITARPLTDEDREWLSQPEVARSIETIRSVSKMRRDHVHPRDNLELDLGLDSMERVELLASLEQELGARVPDSLASSVYTVRELVDAVRQSAGGTAPAEQRFAWEAILTANPTEPEVLAITQPRPISQRLWFLGGRLVNLFVRDFFHLTVTGLEKLPPHGPFILSPNHQSFLDAPVLVALMPYHIHRDLFYVGTSEIFGAGIARVLARSIKLIPVDPDANLVPAMRAGAYGLRHGKVLVLYPEGERSVDGRPKTFKKGAAILATHLKVPIVPVAMDGFFEAWPRGKGFQRFADLRVTIGDPIPPPAEVRNPETVYEALTEELKSRVMTMWLRLHGEQEKALAHAAD